MYNLGAMKPLKVFIFSDLYPSERASIQSCLNELQNLIALEIISVESHHRNYFKKAQLEAPGWIISRDWRSALHFLSGAESKERLIVSVLACLNRKISVWETWFQSIKGPLPPQIRLLTHTALSHKFLRELEGVPEVQLDFLPLPIPQISAFSSGSHFTVGSFCSFVPESNLHFTLTLAHYFKKEGHPIQMKLIGQGPLRNHLMKLIEELELKEQVSLIAPKDFRSWEKLDVALFFPTRVENFSSLLLAVATESAPICAAQTVKEFSLTDGVNTFLFESEETKPIAEMILRLKENPVLLSEIRKRFTQKMQKELSPSSLAVQYLNLFLDKPYFNQNFVRCAL